MKKEAKEKRQMGGCAGEEGWKSSKAGAGEKSPPRDEYRRRTLRASHRRRCYRTHSRRFRKMRTLFAPPRPFALGGDTLYRVTIEKVASFNASMPLNQRKFISCIESIQDRACEALDAMQLIMGNAGSYIVKASCFLIDG